MALVLVHYLVNHHQQQNSVDRTILAAVVPRRPTFQNPESSERWTRAFDEAVLFLGDTQIVTSVAILLSGYIQLPCGLSAYHWEIIVDLAWFSALTHLTVLTSLRYYFRRRPAMAIWRVIFMGVTLILLGSALYPVGYIPQYYDQLDKPYPTPIHAEPGFVGLMSSPAICLMSSRRRTELAVTLGSLSASVEGSEQLDTIPLPFNTMLVALSLAYFAVGYVTRVTRLFAPLSDRANAWFRVAPVNLMCRIYEFNARRTPSPRCRIPWQLWKGFWLVCIVTSEAVYEILDSTIWEISWLAAALVFGTLRLIGHKQTSSPSGENTWGFGQVLALILSALPLWSFYSTLQEATHNPLSIQTNTFVLQNVTGIDRLGDQYWFKGLVGFLFGTAMTFIFGTIYIFSFSFLNPKDSEGGDTLYYGAGHIAFLYAVASLSSMLVSTALVSLALGLHFDVLGTSTLKLWWRRRTMTWGALAQHKACKWTWIVIVSLLLAVQCTTLIVVYLLVYRPWSDSDQAWAGKGKRPQRGAYLEVRRLHELERKSSLLLFDRSDVSAQ